KPGNLNQLSNKIVTASNSAACGIELTIGKEYLIGGSIDENGALRGNLCGLVQEWSTVSTADRKALESYKC
ncbi:NTR domain-containing protein, partial [Trichostrongylus colubriformis]